jgi:hypothetical protein
MKYLTSGDIAELIAPTGVTDKQFQAWCNRNLIIPVAGGGTRGCHRRFTLMQVVGIAVAAKVYAGERGCVPDYVGAVVEAFASVTVEWLLNQFENGQTHFITPHHGRPLLGGPQYPEWVDVEGTYREVRARVAEAEPLRK